MDQRILDQIDLLRRESRVQRNLAVGILLYALVTTYLVVLPVLSPMGILFALFLFFCARGIHQSAAALQPEQWGSPEQILEAIGQIREESVWKLHTRLALLFTFYLVSILAHPTLLQAGSMAMTLALCALYEWALRRFDRRVGL